MDNKDITSILNNEEYFSDLKLNPHGVDGYKDSISQAFKITNNALSLYGFNAEEVAGRYSLDLTVNGTKIKFNVKQGEEIDTENLVIGLNKVLEAVSYKEGKQFVEVSVDDINYGIAFINDKKINALKNNGLPVTSKVVEPEIKVPAIETIPVKPTEVVSEDPTPEPEAPMSSFTEVKQTYHPDAPLEKKEEIYTAFTEPEEAAIDKVEDVESASVNDLLDQLMSETKTEPTNVDPPKPSTSEGNVIKDFDVDKFMGFTPSADKPPSPPSSSRPVRPIPRNSPPPKPVINVSEDKLNEMRQYSDYRLMNTVKQSNNYSEIDVEAAKIVLDERGIQQKSQSTKVGKLPQYVKYAEMQLKRGVGPANILKDLQQRGMPGDLAREALSKASSNIRNSRSSSAGQGSSGMSVWGWIIAIIVIIRILALIARG